MRQGYSIPRLARANHLSCGLSVGRGVKGSMECGMMLHITHTNLYSSLAWLNMCLALVVLMPPRGASGAIHHIIDLSINGFTLTATFFFTNLEGVDTIIISSPFIDRYLNITRDVDLGVVRKLECLDPCVKDHVCALFRRHRVTLLPVSNQFWHSKNQFYHEHKMV